jgi:hypothetical protein
LNFDAISVIGLVNAVNKAYVAFILKGAEFINVDGSELQETNSPLKSSAELQVTWWGIFGVGDITPISSNAYETPCIVSFELCVNMEFL